MKDIIRMAGTYTSHAIWCLSEGEGLTTIVGYSLQGGGRKMLRLAMDASDASVEGEQRINNLVQDQLGGVLIRDAYVTLDQVKTDSLVVDIRFAEDAARKIQYLIPYRCASNPLGFGLHRIKVAQFEGIDRAMLGDLTEEFIAGIESHEQGGEVWRERDLEKLGTGSVATSTQSKSAKDSVVMFAPFIIFVLVSAIDGKIDEKEYAAFLKIVLNPEKYNCALLHEIAKQYGYKVREVLDELIREADQLPHYLAAISQQVDEEMDPKEGFRFKQALYDIGVEIAEASGGFLGFGKKISESEKRALAAIKVLLDL